MARKKKFCGECDRCLSCGKPMSEHGCPKSCTLPHYPTWPYYGWPYWYVPYVQQPNVTISQPAITWGGTVFNGTIAGASNSSVVGTYLITSGTDVDH